MKLMATPQHAHDERPTRRRLVAEAFVFLAVLIVIIVGAMSLGYRA